MKRKTKAGRQWGKVRLFLISSFFPLEFWNIWDCYHQQWVKLYHVSSQSLCLSAEGRAEGGDSGQLYPLQSSDSVTIQMERGKLASPRTENSIVQWMVLSTYLGKNSALSQNQIFPALIASSYSHVVNNNGSSMF